MTRILAFVFSVFIPLAASAADALDTTVDGLVRPVGDSDLSEFLWINRPIVVFADSPADPRFHQQINLLLEDEAMLRDRDVVVLTDTDPAALSAVRKKLRPRGFQVTLVDKDGVVKLRKPGPRSAREITRVIDSTPERRREVEERRQSR